jgi:hypothetical protein
MKSAVTAAGREIIRVSGQAAGTVNTAPNKNQDRQAADPGSF